VLISQYTITPRAPYSRHCVFFSRWPIGADFYMHAARDRRSFSDARRLSGRSRIRAFYGGLLGLRPIPSPRPDLDLYEFHGGFVLGFFFTDSPAEVLSPEDYAKATWLEIKVQNPAEWKTKLLAFGVREIAFPDPDRFFFQAPGGQVFRLAPMDGGL
jgi:hypothetical protein